VTFAEFLQNYPLLKKHTFERTFGIDDVFYNGYNAIQAYCHNCTAERTFTYSNDSLLFHNKLSGITGQLFTDASVSYSPSIGGHFIGNKGRNWDYIFYLCYRCSFCSLNERVYFVWNTADKRTFMKVGQFPAWDIEIPGNLGTMLKSHSSTFKKGMICESQGYGIGAFAYYRRIVELIIDELLTSIDSLLLGTDKDAYEKGLAKTKETIVASDKIALVKDLLPASLRPQNMNPLQILHSALSEGLHTLTDDACLAYAEAVRTTLIFLVDQIALQGQAQKSLTDSMKKLMERRGNPPKS
jgi:hypothetical protein